MFDLSAKQLRFLVKQVGRMALGIGAPIFLQRKTLNALGGYLPLPGKVSIDKQVLASRPAWWFSSPDSQQAKVILYLHGGVYCIGSPRSHRDLCAHLALYSGAQVVALDYSLAPEQVFPVAIDDVVAAYEALLSMGYDGKDIALAGDSAGGGLTLAALLDIRRKALPSPAAGYLISPWLDVRNVNASHQSKAAVDPLLSTAWLNQLGGHYLNGQSADNERVSPLLGEMHDLPSMLVQVGEDEVLLDDSLQLETRAQAAGTDISCRVYPALWHVFQFTPSMLKEGRDALQQAGQFLNSALNRAA